MPSHEEITQDALTNPRYDDFFSFYQPQVRAAFARLYSSQKFVWQWRGAGELAQQEHQASRFREAAYSRLWDIQRKKLFDLQCRWRAGQLTLPGVGCTHDFGVLDADIENCPLLDPISPDELDMYSDFVRLTTDFDDVLDTHNGPWFSPRHWQDYELMKLHEQEFDQQTPDHECRGFPAPAWYDFHNTRTGHGLLLALPDVRGAAEQPYRKAYWAHRQAQFASQRAAEPPPPPDPDPRPARLNMADMEDLLEGFVEEFETPLLRRQRAAYEELTAREEGDKQVEEDFAYLKSLDLADAVPLGAAPNWRAALRQAVVESQRQQLLAHLPLAYEDYLLHRQLGIAHPTAKEDRDRDVRSYQGWREELLDGRELLGEPRDFAF